MRGLIFCLALMLAGPAAAQNSYITITADPVPIIAADINGRALRLEVDPSLPDVIVLNPDAARRLNVHTIPMVRAAAVLDDARIVGRVARPRVRFADGAEARAFTGIFNVPASARADGVIGPGVLPHDVVEIRFGAPQEGAREISFALEKADVWLAQTTLAPGIDTGFDVTFSRLNTLLNRPAAARLEAARMLTPAGELQPRELVLGLTTLMQPVEVDPSIQIGGLSLGLAFARTGAPILGADDDTVTVLADSDHAPPPRLTLGREALAGCFSIRVERAAKRMVLACS